MAAERCEIAVVGGGISGTAAAYHLARAGASVLLLERHEIGTEASGRNAGSLHGQLQHEPFRLRGEAWARTFLPALEFLHRSLRRWATLSDELGVDLEVTTNGGLLLVDDPAYLRLVEAKVALERETGVDARVLDAGEVRRLAPWVGEAIVGAGFMPVEGKANPMLAAPAFAAAASAAGARLETGTAVHSIEEEAAGLRLLTDRGEVLAAQVVLTSGRELARHAAALGTPIPIEDEPAQVSATEPVAPLVHHLVYYAGGRLTLKQAKAGSLLIGGGWEARTDPVSGYPRVDVANLRANLEVALRVAPALAEALVIRSWAGIGSVTADMLPVIGTLPGSGRVHAGMFPHMGLTAGPLMGEVLACLAGGTAVPVEISPFRPDRFAA
jgi:glycine/D-amino acid oxidase-like deaminating enzyme